MLCLGSDMHGMAWHRSSNWEVWVWQAKHMGNFLRCTLSQILKQVHHHESNGLCLLLVVQLLFEQVCPNHASTLI